MINQILHDHYQLKSVIVLAVSATSTALFALAMVWTSGIVAAIPIKPIHCAMLEDI